MRVGSTVPEEGTVIDWDISEIMSRPSLDSYCYNSWEQMLEQKRSDYHYKDVLASIKQWGFIRPLTAYISEKELRLGDGHHRLAAAIELGMTTVPVEVHWNAMVADDSGGWDAGSGVDYIKSVELEEIY